MQRLGTGRRGLAGYRKLEPRPVTEPRGPCRIAALKQALDAGSRTARLRGKRLTLELVERNKQVEEAYDLIEIGSDLGRGFRLAKIGGDEVVHETHIGGERVWCDCSGFQAGAFVCRHIAALVALLAAGAIAGKVQG